MKTPDEIKKGLECCIPRYESNHWVTCSDECPYRSEGAFCRNVMQNNVRAYIHQLERERDAAVEDLKSVVASNYFDGDYCKLCKYKEPDGECYHTCIPYSSEWGWEWRGVKKSE